GAAGQRGRGGRRKRGPGGRVGRRRAAMTVARGWSYGVLIALLVVIYFGLHLVLGLGDAVPDLLTVAVLLAARRLGGSAAAILGSQARDVFFGGSLGFVGAYLFIGKWLHGAVYHVVAASGGRWETATSRLLIEAPLASLYAAAAGVGALLLYRLVTGER